MLLPEQLKDAATITDDGLANLQEEIYLLAERIVLCECANEKPKVFAFIADHKPIQNVFQNRLRVEIDKILGEASRDVLEEVKTYMPGNKNRY